VTRRGGIICASAIVAVLAGCGSASDREPLSRAGLAASQHKLVADVQAGRYGGACEAFTPDLRHVFKAFRQGGCAGFLKATVAGVDRLCAAFERPSPGAPEPFRVLPEAKGVTPLKRARDRLRDACRKDKKRAGFAAIPAHVRIAGNTAYDGHTVYARYEAGRWRFAPSGGPVRSPAALEAALRHLGASNAGGLLTLPVTGGAPSRRGSTITVGNAR
jgi:hypothetical protein